MRPLIAATATQDRPLPWGWLLGALLVAALAYAASCAWWPFAHCRKCEGRGKFARKDSKVWRRCRRCKGSGTRLRFGRRVWNRFARVRKAAS
ncbi:hypothetical protein AB0J77_14855 [Micromonospora tulbaghiae]|uniref:hypothetical protein n=1 Tax=Micromonospora tulbaghiae TaxID=479978 RepID=UPI00343874D5